MISTRTLPHLIFESFDIYSSALKSCEPQITRNQVNKMILLIPIIMEIIILTVSILEILQMLFSHDCVDWFLKF